MDRSGTINPSFDPLKAVETFEVINPFLKDNPSTPKMPISGFPKIIQSVIIECAQVYGTNRDLWTGAILMAAATAIGQSTILKTKFENPPLFWLSTVAGSGLGKSEPFHFAFKALFSRDVELLNQHYKDLEQYEKDVKDAKDKKHDKPLKPICKQIITVDSTPEKLAKIMSQNNQGIIILRDELSGWFNDFGRYARSGEQQNMLSSWSQSTYRVDRVNASPYLINKPFCNVCGGIQPSLLTEMAKDNRDINGFLPRFCFVFPDKLQMPFYQNIMLSNDFYFDYQNFISRLSSIQGYRCEVKLSQNAENLYEVFFNNNARLNNSGQADYLNEVNSKLNIIVLRLAVLFHVCNDRLYDVQEDTMKFAIELAEYFRFTQKKVFDIINVTNIDTKLIIKYLSEKGNSQSDIARILKCSQQYVSTVLSCKAK